LICSNGSVAKGVEKSTNKGFFNGSNLGV